MDHMTALVSTFARAYHYRNNEEWVFADAYAEKMLKVEEYEGIAHHMAEGIAYFAPGFEGTKEEALRYIVDHQLAPSVLARSAFCQKAMDNAVYNGCRQIVLYAGGYDTTALRIHNKDVKLFDLDLPEVISDKQKRMAFGQPVCQVEYIGCDLAETGWMQDLVQAGYQKEDMSFSSLLGISYYLSRENFQTLLSGIGRISRKGSAICFDYPMAEEGKESLRNRELAAAAGERMKAKYTYEQLKALLEEAGFEIIRHLDAGAAEEAFFTSYNRRYPEHRMAAPQGVGYCLAVKQASY